MFNSNWPYIQMHRAGYKVVAITAVIAFALSVLSHSIAFALLLILITMLVCYFFRDPARMVPRDERLILAPADGIISFIERGVSPPPELGMRETDMIQISIFLSVMDVHVNRVPITGRVRNMHYCVGKFKNMMMDSASKDIDPTGSYEKQLTVIEDSQGSEFAVAQVAGFIARRIICEVKPGDEVTKGKRLGIICFGSRVDIYIPNRDDIIIMASVGQTMVGGETIIGIVADGQQRQHLENSLEAEAV